MLNDVLQQEETKVMNGSQESMLESDPAMDNFFLWEIKTIQKYEVNLALFVFVWSQETTNESNYFLFQFVMKKLREFFSSYICWSN